MTAELTEERIEQIREGRYHSPEELSFLCDAALRDVRARGQSDEVTLLNARIDELKSDNAALVRACNDLQGPTHMGEPVIPVCSSGITVPRKAVDYLKEKFPGLCVTAGLCELVAGRLYTKTVMGASQPTYAEGKRDGLLKAAELCFARAESWLTVHGRASDPTGIAQAEALGCAEQLRALAEKEG